MAPRVIASGLPAVTLLYGADLHSVRSDTESCARLAGEHLVFCGYRRLGYVGEVHGKPSIRQALLDAFSQSAIKRGCPTPIQASFESDDLGDPERSASVRQAMAEWIQQQDKPIGLYIQHSATARYLAEICGQLGLRVPEDVGILAHGVDKFTATSITPTLSEVAIDHWEQGYQAASILDRLMRGEQVDPKIRYITNPRIIARESSDRFISEDELVSHAMRYIAEHCRRAISAEDVAAQLKGLPPNHRSAV